MAVRGGVSKSTFLIIAIIAFAGLSTTTIAQDAVASSEIVAAPEAREKVAEAAAAPLDDAAAPEEEVAVPEEEVAAPIEDAAEPQEDAAKPKEDAAAPKESVAEPIALEPEEEPRPVVAEVPAAKEADETPEAAEEVGVVAKVAPAESEAPEGAADVAAPAVDEVAVDPVLTSKATAEDPVVVAIDEVAAKESAEVTDEAAEDVAADNAAVVEAIETYAIPSEPLTKLVLAEGDAFTLTCYALNQDYKGYDPLIKWRPNPNAEFLNLFFGTRARPGIPAAIEGAVSARQEGHLYHYNFHAASAGVAGEYECDYTVNEKDVIYHVVVLAKDSITCPAGGSFPDQSKIPEVSCSVSYAGFFPDGFGSQPTIQLAGDDLKSISSFMSEGNKLNIVAEDIFVVRLLNEAKFRCVFPVNSVSQSLTCESPPLTVTWEPGKPVLKAPASIVKDSPQEVTCSVDDLGNPPTTIDIEVLGNEEAKSVQNGSVATLPYTETRELNLIQFVCRTPADRVEQIADVYYGPEAVTSLSTDTAVMVENTLFSWECFPTPSNPPAEVEYSICDDPEDAATCTKIENSKELHACKSLRHKYLLCTATNAQTLHQVRNVPHMIDVHHAPVYAAGKTNEVGLLVRKGESFTLDCLHEANPEMIIYEWEKKIFDEEDNAILKRKRREDVGFVAAGATPAPVVAEKAAPAATVAEPVEVSVSVEGTPAPKVAEEEEAAEKESPASEEVAVEVVIEDAAAPADGEPADVNIAAPTAGEEEASEEIAVSEEAAASAEGAEPKEEAASEEEPAPQVDAASAEVAEPVDAASLSEEGAKPEADEENVAAEGAAEVVPATGATVTEEVPIAKGAAEEPVQAAPVVEEAPTAEAPAIEDNSLVAYVATISPTIEITTARPLRPSVDLSSHNATKWSVAAAEDKHFGVYFCKAKNSIGDNRIRYSVKKNTAPTEEERRRKEKEEADKRKANSAPILRISPAVALATSLSLVLFR